MANQKYKIELTAIDKTKAAFSKVKAGLGGVKNAAVGVTKVIGGTAIAFAAVASTLAVVAKKSFDFADAIGKVSTRTGIATDAIQAFQIAAVLAGGDTEGANTALEKFTRSVGDAQRGLKTQTDIFKDLNVQIVDVNGNTKSMDVLLREVTEAIGGLSSQSEKATVAANLFGRQGIKLLGAIDNLGMGLDGFIDKAKQYNLILDEESIKKSELFNDTLFILTRQFRILVAELSIAFLPILQKLTAGLVDNNAGFLESQGGVKTFAETIRNNLIGAFLGTLKAISALLGAGSDLTLFFVETGLNAGNTAIHFRRLAEATMAATSAARGNVMMAATHVAKYSALGNQLVDVNAKMTQYKEANRDAKGALDEMIVSIEKFLQDALKPTDAETQKLLDNLLGIGKAFKDSGAAVTNIQLPLEVYRDSLNTLEGQTKDFQNATVNGFKKLEDSFVELAMTGKTSFKDLVNSIIADLIRLAIRQQIIAPLFNFFNPEKVAAGLGTPSPSASNFKPFSANGGGFTGFGSRSGGLDGKGGFPAILHPNETVIDHTRGNGAGAIVINQSVNFATGVQDTVKNEVLQLLPEIAETSKGAVLEAMNRGGNFRRGMR
jgi:adhesin HecA-like repeat protein